jgi:hypothetical protein
MIDLTDQDVAEFRALYRTETGRDLSDAEARACTEGLIRLVECLLEADDASAA